MSLRFYFFQEGKLESKDPGPSLQDLNDKQIFMKLNSGTPFTKFFTCFLQIMRGGGNNDPVFLHSNTAMLAIGPANFGFVHGSKYNPKVVTKV